MENEQSIGIKEYIKGEKMCVFSENPGKYPMFGCLGPSMQILSCNIFSDYGYTVVSIFS